MTAISTVYWGAASFASTVARAGCCLATPRHPLRVHFGEGGDVGEPDVGGEQLRLVRAGLGQQRIDDAENFGGLLADALPAAFSATWPAR